MKGLDPVLRVHRLKPSMQGGDLRLRRAFIKEYFMPQSKWSNKRERQYQHIKDSAKARGESETTAERIAAATVNKERARAGESETASPSSLKGPSSGERGGRHSHTGAQGRTKEQLYRAAARQGIKGRSRMSKAQLQAAVGP